MPVGITKLIWQQLEAEKRCRYIMKQADAYSFKPDHEFAQKAMQGTASLHQAQLHYEPFAAKLADCRQRRKAVILRASQIIREIDNANI